ncbi:glycosyltransferase family 9 protein [Candidatus Riflebacteria bacterium]
MLKKFGRWFFFSLPEKKESLNRLLTKKYGNILFIRTDRLGDLVISSPIIRAFKLAHPNWTITLLASPINREAAFGMEYVDRVLVHNKNSFFRTTLKLLNFSFDLSIDLNAAQSFSSGFLSYFSGAKLRLGYRGRNYKHFNNLAVPLKDNPGSIHQLDLQKELARYLGITIQDWNYDYRLPQGAILFAKNFFNAKFSSAETVVAIHPGNIKKKEHRWPINKFIAITDQLALLPGIKFLLIYGPMEKALMKELKNGVKSETQKKIIVPPACTLAQTVALVSQAKVFLDSGPTGTTHIITSIPTPQVIIYSKYSYQMWNTRKSKDRAVISKDWEDTGYVSVAEVYDRIVPLLGNFYKLL